MSATCYPCDHRSGGIPGETVTGHPHGTCRICGVLACGGHGRRDANVRRFECVVCVPSLLVAAAAQQAGGVLPATTPRGVRPPEYPIESVEQFLDHWPEFRDWLRGRLDEVMLGAQGRFNDAFSEPLWFGLPERARELVGAAIAIALGLEIPSRDLPAVLVELVNRWR